jgi:hypothetical protein
VPPTEPAAPGTWQGPQPVIDRPTEAVPPVPPGTPPPAPPAGGAGGGGGGGGKVALIVILVLAILGVGGFLLLSGDGDDDEVSADDTTTTTEADDEDTTTTTEAEETTTTAAEDTTTTTAAEDTTTTATTPPADGGDLTFTQITDDTGQLVVEVPDTWVEVDGSPLSETSPNVQASPDLAGFRQRSASGISFTLLDQQNADPDSTLDFLTSGHTASCQVLERQDYSDGVFTGRLQELADCDGQGIELIVIVASNDAGQSVEVSTVIVPPDDVNAIEQHIIETFNLTS